MVEFDPISVVDFPQLVFNSREYAQQIVLDLVYSMTPSNHCPNEYMFRHEIRQEALRIIAQQFPLDLQDYLKWNALLSDMLIRPIRL